MRDACCLCGAPYPDHWLLVTGRPRVDAVAVCDACVERYGDDAFHQAETIARVLRPLARSPPVAPPPPSVLNHPPNDRERNTDP